VTDIAQKLLLKGLPVPRETILDTLISQNGDVIDQGLMVYMRRPASYTGEDTLELSLHGGRIIIEKAFEAIQHCGARLADPGEFTRRAFEAGKMDLTRAESIADLIDAESEAQHKQALKQYDGALDKLYSGWRENLTACLALLEASIDFPDEEDAPDKVDTPVLLKLSDMIASLETALEIGHISERIRDGFKVAILGEPNAGKSTLLNNLVGRNAAIVTDIPGTTRDIVEVRMKIGGYLVYLSDTAGLRDTNDIVEAEGVKRALALSDTADLRLWLTPIDGVSDLSRPNTNRDIHILTKCDLPHERRVSRETLSVSADTGQGVNDLVVRIESHLSNLGRSAPSPVITRARHRQAIIAAQAHIHEAYTMLNNGYGAELVSEEVRLGSRMLGTLTGHIDAESVLGAVFSSFCIGK
jgi:tRNA modification GTPase